MEQFSFEELFEAALRIKQGEPERSLVSCVREVQEAVRQLTHREEDQG